MNAHVTHLVKKNSFLTACGRQVGVNARVATSSLKDFMSDAGHCQVCEEFAKKAIAARKEKA